MVDGLFSRPKPEDMKVNRLTKTDEIIKLVSNDDKIFFLNKDVAAQSKKLREELRDYPAGPNDEVQTINLDLDSATLETVIRYLHFRIINADLESE